MRLCDNRRGVSGEVMKLAVASILGLALFAVLLSFAASPLEADKEIAAAGQSLLNWTQNATVEILAHE